MTDAERIEKARVKLADARAHLAIVDADDAQAADAAVQDATRKVARCRRTFLRVKTEVAASVAARRRMR